MLVFSLIACFASPYGDDVLPLEEQLRINLPTDPAAAKTASDPDAEWAEFYVVTRNVTESVNGMVAFVLGTVGAVTLLRPTWVDDAQSTAMWGPYSDSGLDPVETGLLVTRNDDATTSWFLFQIPNGGSVDTDRVDIVSGLVDAGSTRKDASGTFFLDFTTAASMDPSVNLVGTWNVDYTYDAEGVAGVVVADDYGLRGGGRIDAQYAYQEDYAGAGSMDLAWQDDFDGDAGPDDAAMRSRWQADGQGRSDARITTAQHGEVTATECWGTTFSRVYWADSVGLQPNEGDATACAFEATEYPSDASFDPVD